MENKRDETRSCFQEFTLEKRKHMCIKITIQFKGEYAQCYACRYQEITSNNLHNNCILSTNCEPGTVLQPKDREPVFLGPTSNTWKRINSPVPANCCTEQKTRGCDPEFWRSRRWSAKVSDISDIWAETGGTPAGQLWEDLLKGSSAPREKQVPGARGFKALTQSEKLVRWQGARGVDRPARTPHSGCGEGFEV